MCQVLLISTREYIDLTHFNCSQLSFNCDLPNFVPEIHEMKFQHRWYIAGYPDQTACSCHFRFLPLALGFKEPESWFPEDIESICATHYAYDVFKQIAALEVNFEIIVSWTQGSINEDVNTIHNIEIDFDQIPKEKFVFIENSRMLFSS